MALNRPPMQRKKRTGFHYLGHGMNNIPTGSKARHAIAEAKRFGASGKELRFALMTIAHRVLMIGRSMYEDLDYKQVEALKEFNKLTGVDESTRRVLANIDAERSAAMKQKKEGKAERAKQPSIKLDGLRERLVNAIRGVNEFGRDADIKTRYKVFDNLMNEAKKGECEQVCKWLEAMGECYMQRARNAKSYSQYASQADFSMRCYGAAGVIYGNHGFKKQQLELQKLGYALNARLGFA